MSGSLQSDIRQALAAENFAEARRLWGEYIESLLDAIRRGEATANQLKEAAELLQFAKCAALSLRARSSEHIAEAHAASVYARKGLFPESRFRAVL